MKHDSAMKSATVLLRICLLLFLVIPAAAPPEAGAELIDRVVAEVNDDVITLSELEEEGQPYFRKILAEVEPENREAALDRAQNQVLDGLIDKALIAQEAAKQGLTVSDDEIDAAFAQMVSINNTTREALLDQLAANGIDEATYRDNLKSQIYQNKLVTRDVRSKIIITEEMILDFYDTQYTRHVDEGGYYLLQIGTTWGETEGAEAADESRRDALTRAERVRKLASDGQDFRELARKFSDLPSAADGGDIGVFQEGDMAADMKKAVTALQPGDISAIVETPVGYQFFKLLSSRDGGIVMQASYESVKEEIRDRLFREALQQEFETWIDGIRQRAYIRRLL